MAAEAARTHLRAGLPRDNAVAVDDMTVNELITNAPNKPSTQGFKALKAGAATYKEACEDRGLLFDDKEWDNVLCDAIKVLGCLAAQNHGLVAEVVWPETLHRLSECASRATDRQVGELFQQVSHALGAGQQWGGWSSSWW